VPLQKKQISSSLFLKIIGTVIILGILFLSFFDLRLPSSLIEKDNWGPSMDKNIPIDSVQNDFKTNSIPFWFQFTEFDSRSGYLSANAYLWPSKDLAQEFSSSTKLKVPVKVFIDNLYSNTSYNFTSEQTIGAIPIVLDSTNPMNLNRSNEFFFPFDKYSIDSYVKIEQGNNVTENRFLPANTYEFFWQPQIPGFSFNIWRGSTFQDTYDWFSAEAYDQERVLQQRQNGEISTLIEVSRSSAVKLASLLLYFGILVGSLSLFFTSLYVARAKRPSSLTALVWSAASILGAIQLRDLIPGDPGIGTFLDFLFFYPALLLSILSIAILSIYWVKRENYAI
jgi:hypothetical protein